MKRLQKIGLLLLCFVGQCAFAGEADSMATKAKATERYFSYENSVLMLVGSHEAAARALIAWAETHGGWFEKWNATAITLRIPKASVPMLYDTLRIMGTLGEQTVQSEDHTLEVADLQSRIEGRRKLLDNYYAMVRTANFQRLQVVEREVVNRIAEIEMLEGQLRVIQERLSMAQVEVHFQLYDRNLPSPDGRSPFPWIGNLNLEPLRRSFQ